MKETILAAVIGGTLAGAVSAGFVSTFLASPPLAETQTASLQPLSGLGSSESLENGIEALNDQLTELSMRLASLEARGPERVAVRESGELRSEEQRLDGMSEMLASLATPGSAVDPLFQSKVAAAIERIQEEEAQAREQEEFERIQEEVDERLERLQPELGLDAGQKNSLRTVLIDERVRRNDLMRSMRDGGEFSRDEFRTLRDRTEEALKLVLSPAQLVTYEESQRDERRRFFGGGGDREGDGGRRGRDGNGGDNGF